MLKDDPTLISESKMAAVVPRRAATRRTARMQDHHRDPGSNSDVVADVVGVAKLLHSVLGWLATMFVEIVCRELAAEDPRSLSKCSEHGDEVCVFFLANFPRSLFWRKQDVIPL